LLSGNSGITCFSEWISHEHVFLPAMNKMLLFLGLGMFFLGACQQGIEIEGQLDQSPAQSFRLEELDIEENRFVDSGRVDEKGHFKLSAKIGEEGLYRIKFEQNKYILLAMKKGEQIQIKGNWNQLEDYQVNGSSGSIALKSFLVNLRENIKDIRTMQLIIDSIATRPNNDSILSMAKEDMRIINARFMDYVKKFADTTQSVTSALFAVNIINPAFEGPYVRKFYEQVTTRFPESKKAKAFADRFLKGSVSPAPAATTKAATGNPAADFSAPTPDGQSISLSSFKGKWVLIDFWASWCAPCRAENPNVVRAFQQFSQKNFTILGVSLDTSKEKWIEAIEKDQLKWNHVSELKGWSSAIARNYSVESIPQNFLVDPNGNIVATNLKGDALVQKLSELLK
jgi:peroxiredoxin